MTDPVEPDGPEEPVSCSSCGATRQDGAASQLAWSTSTERGAVRAVCPACTRSNLRSIEAKLPEEWW